MDTLNGNARSKSVRTRERIFDAAVEVFRHDGFAEARLADIADRADLQTASLYYHFDSKEALVEAVLSQGIQYIFDHVRQAVEAIPEADPAGRLSAAITAHLEAAFDPEHHRAPTARLFGQIPSTVRHRLGAQNELITRYWEDLVSRAQRAHLIRTDLDPRTLSLLVLGSLNWATEWYHQEGQPISEIARHLTAILFTTPLESRLDRDPVSQPTLKLDRVTAKGKSRRGRGEFTLSAVIAAARECFAESGVGATRMDDVAQRAGVSRPHLYAFVKGRAQLVELVALARLHELGAILEQRARDLDGDVAEAIVDQIVETTRLGRDDPEYSLLADAMPRFELNDLLAGAKSPVHEINRKIFGPLLARALSEGRLRSDVPMDAIIEWLQSVTALLASRNDLSDEELSVMTRRFVIPGLFS